MPGLENRPLHGYWWVIHKQTEWIFVESYIRNRPTVMEANESIPITIYDKHKEAVERFNSEL